MKKDKSEKINFICYLIASACFYISGILDIINKDDNWVTGLCLSTTHSNKNNDKKINSFKLQLIHDTISSINVMHCCCYF